MRKITNEELHRPSVEEFAAMPKLPLVVVLDNVRSAQNVGSFFRTGDAFAVDPFHHRSPLPDSILHRDERMGVAPYPGSAGTEGTRMLPFALSQP